VLLPADDNDLFYVNPVNAYRFHNYKLMAHARISSKDNLDLKKKDAVLVTKDYFVLTWSMDKDRIESKVALYGRETLILKKEVFLQFHLSYAYPSFEDLLFINARPSPGNNNVDVWRLDKNSSTAQPAAVFSSSFECRDLKHQEIARNSHLVVAVCWDSPNTRYLAAMDFTDSCPVWQVPIAGDAELFVDYYPYFEVGMTESYSCLYCEKHIIKVSLTYAEYLFVS